MTSPLIQKLDEIEKGLVCLVPNPGAQNVITCHEYSICDCEVLKLTSALRLSIEIAENVIEFSHNEITQDIKGRFFQMGKEYLTQEYIESSSALKYLREQKEAITQLGLGEGGKEL